MDGTVRGRASALWFWGLQSFRTPPRELKSAPNCPALHVEWRPQRPTLLKRLQPTWPGGTSRKEVESLLPSTHVAKKQMRMNTGRKRESTRGAGLGVEESSAHQSVGIWAAELQF